MLDANRLLLIPSRSLVTYRLQISCWKSKPGFTPLGLRRVLAGYALLTFSSMLVFVPASHAEVFVLPLPIAAIFSEYCISQRHRQVRTFQKLTGQLRFFLCSILAYNSLRDGDFDLLPVV